ncbi:MAG: DUF3194 domain-containing protein [Candidatus Bathyarchaeia archaeon]
MVPLLSKQPISTLPYEELEKICDIAEEAARKYVMSRVPREYISDLSISVDLEGSETLNIDIEVELSLSPFYKGASAEELANGSVKAAFDAIEEYLRKIRS